MIPGPIFTPIHLITLTKTKHYRRPHLRPQLQTYLPSELGTSALQLLHVWTNIRPLPSRTTRVSARLPNSVLRVIVSTSLSVSQQVTFVLESPQSVLECLTVLTTRPPPPLPPPEKYDLMKKGTPTNKPSVTHIAGQKARLSQLLTHIAAIAKIRQPPQPASFAIQSPDYKSSSNFCRPSACAPKIASKWASALFIAPMEPPFLATWFA